MSHFLFRLIGLALAALFGASAQAAIFTVGSPSGPGQPCTHGTIQSAINAANNAPGADTVRLTRSLTYQPEANTINTAQELTIEGGYATCTQANPDTTNTVVSGTGGALAPVFTIIAPTGALIHLRRLTISGGDVAGSGKGGGIRFEGDGKLEISDSTISNNVAGYGGGIAASGTGANAKLVIGANVLVAGNTAPYGGGGIYAHEIEMTMREPGSTLFNNKSLGAGGSAGFGGGLYLHANHRNTMALIGTSGMGGLGAIYGNQARYGGGVALAGYNSDLMTSQHISLHLFSTDIARRGRISGNSATVAGGGLYVEGDNGTLDGEIDSRAFLWNAVLDDNIAPDGAAVRLGGDGVAGFYFNRPDGVGEWARPSGALPCSPGAGDCGRIVGNAAMNGSTYTNGAILRGGATHQFIRIGIDVSSSTGAPVPAEGGVVIHGNKGGRLIEMDSATPRVEVHDALIAANDFSQHAIRMPAGTFKMTDVTLAGNTIGGAHVLSTGSTDVTLARSILWQPGTPILTRSGGTLSQGFVVASDTASFGGTAYGFNPRFVDPEHGDYTLRAGSPAIDLAPAIAGDDRDALGLPRDVDLPIKANYQGPRDLGAFERQSLQPMVLNGDFDAPDLRLWTPVLAGSTTRDATQNVSGASGSGSAHVTRTNPAFGQETRGLSQCIHLPGPAFYALNGWGRGTGTMFVGGDQAQLHWEYRRNGGENCSGAADASGWHLLSSTSAWNRPAEPSLIEVSEANWGGSSSIKVTLVAVEFGPSGADATHAWFDGITLDAVPLDDLIFANGFER